VKAKSFENKMLKASRAANVVAVSVGLKHPVEGISA